VRAASYSKHPHSSGSPSPFIPFEDSLHVATVFGAIAGLACLALAALVVDDPTTLVWSFAALLFALTGMIGLWICLDE
jgi:hypothetical protein